MIFKITLAILSCISFNKVLNDFESSIQTENYEFTVQYAKQLHSFNNVPWEASEILLKRHASGDLMLPSSLLDSIVINLGANGVPRDYISQMLSEDEFNDKKNEWEEGHRRFQKSYSRELRYGIDSLLNVDQDTRETKSKRERAITDSLTFLRFKELYDNFGYPHPKRIGVYYFSRGNEIILNNSYNRILYRHYAQHEFEDYYRILLTALLNKEITAYEFTELETHYHLENNYAITPLYRINGQYYVENYSKKHIAKIDSLRSGRGMLTYSNQIEQAIYQRENDIGYKYHQVINTMYPDSIISKYFKPLNLEK